MPKHIDKQQAIILREQGKSYQEIAQQLGCSIPWCKANLKHVPKGYDKTSTLAELKDVRNKVNNLIYRLES